MMRPEIQRLSFVALFCFCKHFRNHKHLFYEPYGYNGNLLYCGIYRSYFVLLLYNIIRLIITYQKKTCLLQRFSKNEFRIQIKLERESISNYSAVNSLSQQQLLQSKQTVQCFQKIQQGDIFRKLQFIVASFHITYLFSFCAYSFLAFLSFIATLSNENILRLCCWPRRHKNMH